MSGEKGEIKQTHTCGKPCICEVEGSVDKQEKPIRQDRSVLCYLQESFSLTEDLMNPLRGDLLARINCAIRLFKRQPTKGCICEAGQGKSGTFKISAYCFVMDAEDLAQDLMNPLREDIVYNLCCARRLMKK